MVRWLLLALGILLASPSAEAQVFKPRGKPPATSKPTKKPAAKKRTPARRTTSHRTHRTSAHSRAARGKGRPSNLTPRSRHVDPDFVLITDDDDIE